jgi:hypothetical protein
MRFLFVIFAASSLAAQTPPAPKPGPEHEKLGFFIGRWRSESDMKPGPMGPGGKVTGTSSCDWFSGNFYVVCNADGRGPTSPMKSHWIMGYSGEKQRYTYYGIDNTGMGGDVIALGVVAGQTWSWTGEGTMGGQPLQGRFTMNQVSPDQYTWTWEVAMGNAPLAVVATGTETRIKNRN